MLLDSRALQIDYLDFLGARNRKIVDLGFSRSEKAENG